MKGYVFIMNEGEEKKFELKIRSSCYMFCFVSFLRVVEWKLLGIVFMVFSILVVLVCKM